MGSHIVSPKGHKIAHDLWWHHFGLKTNSYGNTHVIPIMGYLQHSTRVSIISKHTHTKLHISTYSYACQHKNMSHPPQEGSNRSLAYCTLLGVLWLMCHAWITYGTIRRTVQMLGGLGVSSKKQQETHPIACFWGSHGSLTMLGLPIGRFIGHCSDERPCYTWSHLS